MRLRTSARIALLIMMVSSALPAAAQTIQGRVAHVRDADTIELATSRGRIAVRLNGLDSPELDERGGRAGKAWVERNYAGTILTCELNGQRTYDRWVGICFGSKDEDIAAAIVAAGHGRDCPRYSGGRYRKFENEASRAIPMKPYCRRR